LGKEVKQQSEGPAYKLARRSEKTNKTSAVIANTDRLKILPKRKDQAFMSSHSKLGKAYNWKNNKNRKKGGQAQKEGGGNEQKGRTKKGGSYQKKTMAPISVNFSDSIPKAQTN